MKLKKIAASVLFGLFSLTSTASADHHGDKKKTEKEKPAPKTIVETAVAAGNFKVLAAALEAADLVETLNGKGPFTVFAPTDEAFAKITKESLADLLKPENKAKLVELLTYHVVAGKVMAGTAVTLDQATALNGKDIALTVKDGVLMLDGSAKVIQADVEASNGVIHVIDTVVVPPSE